MKHLALCLTVIVLFSFCKIEQVKAQSPSPDWSRLLDFNLLQDGASDLIVDYYGNAFVCGQTYRTGSRSDYFIAKYRTDGTFYDGSQSKRIWDTVSGTSTSLSAANSIAFN